MWIGIPYFSETFRLSLDPKENYLYFPARAWIILLKVSRMLIVVGTLVLYEPMISACRC